MTEPGDSSLHSRVANQLRSSHAPMSGRKNACENFGAAVYLGSLINRDDYHCNLPNVYFCRSIVTDGALEAQESTLFSLCCDITTKYDRCRPDEAR
nr:hypothetical protein CFP56_22104 [Quercus suber]